MITASCPNCKKPVTYAETAQSATCLGCKGTFRVLGTAPPKAPTNAPPPKAAPPRATQIVVPPLHVAPPLETAPQQNAVPLNQPQELTTAAASEQEDGPVPDASFGSSISIYVFYLGIVGWICLIASGFCILPFIISLSDKNVGQPILWFTMAASAAIVGFGCLVSAELMDAVVRVVRRLSKISDQLDLIAENMSDDESE